MTAREIDIHTLPSMLTALRLPSFHKLWQEIASRADTEGWPAARFLAVLAEYELAERDMRRIRRHLIEAQLPAGKTLATFDFKALPSLPRARVEALAAADWLDGGGNLIAIGNSGTGKTHVLCAIGHALVEAGHRVFYTRTSDLVQKLQVARRDLVLEAALAKLDRFDLIILDEATEGLAPLIREEIWSCLAQLRSAGQTILVIDKYVEKLIALADSHTLIERGQVVWQGNSTALAADHGLWQRYLGV